MLGSRSLALGAVAMSLGIPTNGAPAFLVHVARLLTGNHYAAAYRSLTEVDRALVLRDTYVRCSLTQPIPGRLLSVRVLHTWPEEVVVVQDGPPVASVAVRLEIRIAVPTISRPVRTLVTRHAIREGNRWAWMLPPARLSSFANGCGDRST
jgi:hypothetical protein